MREERLKGVERLVAVRPSKPPRWRQTYPKCVPISGEIAKVNRQLAYRTAVERASPRIISKWLNGQAANLDFIRQSFPECSKIDHVTTMLAGGTISVAGPMLTKVGREYPATLQNARRLLAFVDCELMCELLKIEEGELLAQLARLPKETSHD